MVKSVRDKTRKECLVSITKCKRQFVSKLLDGPLMAPGVKLLDGPLMGPGKFDLKRGVSRPPK